MNDVSITGFGVITPLGMGADENVRAWQEGRQVLEPAQPGLDVLVGRVNGPDSDSILEDPKGITVMSRNAELASCAGLLALRDAGIAPGSDLLLDAGLYLGFGYERRTVEDYASIARASIDRKTHAFGEGMMMRAGIKAQPPYTLLRSLASLGHIAIQAGIKGPNYAFCPNVIAGGQAICAGLDAIRAGSAPVALVGGAEAATDSFGVATHEYLGMQRTEDDTRTGPGEAAVMAVLEGTSAAESRGARIYGYLEGYGECYLPQDALTATPALGALSDAVSACVADSQTTTEDIDAVIHDPRLDATLVRDAVARAGWPLNTADMHTNGTRAGDFGGASVPWSMAMALHSVPPGGGALVCSYGAPGGYCAVMLRRTA